jgi:hypothetical protein
MWKIFGTRGERVLKHASRSAWCWAALDVVGNVLLIFTLHHHHQTQTRASQQLSAARSDIHKGLLPTVATSTTVETLWEELTKKHLEHLVHGATPFEESGATLAIGTYPMYDARWNEPDDTLRLSVG